MGKIRHFCSMEQLNFKRYPISIKIKENKRYIFDVVRKKDILLTPEEWVRQHCLHFLISEKKYPKSLINVEKKIQVFGQVKRFDIAVFTPNGHVNILMECKAPDVSINQTTFDQIAQYNLKMNSTFLMVSNGIQHLYCRINEDRTAYEFLHELPTYTPRQ